MSSESTCLLNGFGYRLQKAPVTWSQLNLRTPEYIYKLPRFTIKVSFESKTKSLLLEHTICTVELHLGCKNYKYHENEETGRSRIQWCSGFTRSKFNETETGSSGRCRRRWHGACFINHIYALILSCPFNFCLSERFLTSLGLKLQKFFKLHRSFYVNRSEELNIDTQCVLSFIDGLTSGQFRLLFHVPRKKTGAWKNSRINQIAD